MPNVLIIDDDEQYRTRISKLLNKENIETQIATNLLEVVETLMRDKDKIDLVLLDIQMPEADGKDVADTIKDYTESIPIIVNSVTPLNDQRLKIGRAREYFQKGSSEKDLIKKIQAIIGGI